MKRSVEKKHRSLLILSYYVITQRQLRYADFYDKLNYTCILIG